MLGPARFSHIETCTREACHAFRVRDELEEHVATLRSLDDILATLRTELATIRGPQKHTEPEDGKDRKPNYESLLTSSDADKVKRLVSARERAIKSVKASIQREKEKQSATGDG